MSERISFTNIPVIFVEKTSSPQKIVSFRDIPVILTGHDITKKCEEIAGLHTKQEREQFLDWYYEEWDSYSEKIRKEEGMDEDEWEDYQWDLEIHRFELPDHASNAITNLPPDKIKFKVIEPGTIIYRVNRSQGIASDNDLWFFLANYAPAWHTLESYGLFSEYNDFYLLKVEVIEPLYVVDMDDLNTILRLMTDEQYRNQEVSDVPFALAMSYAFLSDWGMERTSSYPYDLPIASILCETSEFDGFISTTSPQHPEMVVCNDALDKIRVVDFAKGTKIKELWYLQSIEGIIVYLKGKGEDSWAEEIERLEEILEKRDLEDYDVNMNELEKKSFDELMTLKE